MGIVLRLGQLSGIVGAMLCLVSVLLRLKGYYWLGGFQLGTLLQVGIAAMVFGCFSLLFVLSQLPPQR
jgi:hypothetical protein